MDSLLPELIGECIDHFQPEDRFPASQINRSCRKYCKIISEVVDKWDNFEEAFKNGNLFGLARARIFSRSHATAKHAGLRGSIPLVRLLIRRADNKHACYLVLHAYEGGHLPVINYLKEIGCWDLHGAFVGACYNGNLETINELFDELSLDDHWNYLEIAINIAEKTDNRELLDLYTDRLKQKKIDGRRRH